MSAFVIMLISFFSLPSQSFCSHLEKTNASGTDAKNLRKYLFDTLDYDKKIRPRIRQADVIEVYIDFFLLSINELSEASESLKTTCFLLACWADDYLQWNASDFGGLDFYQWPQADIWRPDLSLQNSYVDYAELGVEALNVQVWSDGWVYWQPFQVFRSTCSVDITYFPFDTQTCHLDFSAWSYSYYEVSLDYFNLGVDTVYFKPNSEWNLIESYVSVPNTSYVSKIRFSLKLRRKPQYIMFTMIIPIMMLAMLNIFVFILPSESGEKASYAVTTFLAFTVLLSIISANMPENSETVALFSVFLLLQSIQSTLITLIVIVLIRCHSFDKTVPIPLLVKVVLRATGCTPCRRKHQISTRSNLVQNIQISEVADGEKAEVVDAHQKEISVPDYTWRQVVSCFDKVFFAFFMIVFVVSVTVCLWLGQQN